MLVTPEIFIVAIGNESLGYLRGCVVARVKACVWIEIHNGPPIKRGSSGGAGARI